jgi:DNA-binding CsgD family transcriptional regulator
MGMCRGMPMSNDRSGSDHDVGTHVLSEFAETFGHSAQKIIHSTGWVVYVVGPELRIKHFLASEAKAAEMADYERHYARLDPLAPANCILNGRLVACLREALVPVSPEHMEYRSAFMGRHHIVDALEIFLRSDSGIIIGCSLVRHGDLQGFSAGEIRQAEGLRSLGEFALSRLLPGSLLKVDTLAGRFPALTPREVALLQLVAVGLSNKQLSDELNIALATVKSHLLSIFRKLDVRSRAELAARVLL